MELRSEIKTVWLHREPFERLAWCRLAVVDDIIPDISPTVWDDKIVIAYTLLRDQVITHYTKLGDVGYVGQPAQKIGRVLFLNCGEQPEGITVVDEPEDAVIPRLDIGITALHPSRQTNRRVLTPEIVAAVTKWNETYHQFHTSRKLIRAQATISPSVNRVDFVISQETSIHWLVDPTTVRKCRWVLETIAGLPCGKQNPLTKSTYRGVTLLGHSITDCGRCRVFALPTGDDGLGEPQGRPGWWTSDPSSIRARRRSRSPRKYLRWPFASKQTKAALSELHHEPELA